MVVPVQIQQWLENTEVDENGCYIWKGKVGNWGYPRTASGTLARHIVAFYAGRPLQGKERPCHTCDVKACINPAHLYLGTTSTNARDVWKDRSNKSHYKDSIVECPKGHIYDDENTYLDKFGHRHCKACSRESTARGRKENRDKINARRRELRRLRNETAREAPH